jgi:hypothetical protein
MFNFASSFCYVVAHSYVAVLGFNSFNKGARDEAMDSVRSQISAP